MEQSKRQYEVLKWASSFLADHHREEHVAQILLQHYLGVSKTAFFAAMRDPVPEPIQHQFENAIRVHAETGIPVQHLTGYEWFYGRKFHVNGDVLIPRPETEELVQHVITQARKWEKQNEPLVIADIGTGSGVIACTLALELPEAIVYATDISQAALVVASQNASDLQAEVTFLQGDFLQPLIQQYLKVDILVSNPPYIAETEKALLSDTVSNYDPALALFSKESGLAAYRDIVKWLPEVILEKALVAFEIGSQQAEAVKRLIQHQFPQEDVAIIADINGKERIISATISQ
ncbi:peptide chain release factor N(5)-glutamine methyltransferase [Lentibacillus sp. N15]|uniref:peptide chain release factor N(5)-glutamine methyltransferase n=1 Tax=Lentibacillus songyuanensis TaxID=3136161 RepID=UPI0031BAEC85